MLTNSNRELRLLETLRAPSGAYKWCTSHHSLDDCCPSNVLSLFRHSPGFSSHPLWNGEGHRYGVRLERASRPIRLYLRPLAKSNRWAEFFFHIISYRHRFGVLPFVKIRNGIFSLLLILLFVFRKVVLQPMEREEIATTSVGWNSNVTRLCRVSSDVKQWIHSWHRRFNIKNLGWEKEKKRIHQLEKDIHDFLFYSERVQRSCRQASWKRRHWSGIYLSCIRIEMTMIISHRAYLTENIRVHQ